MTTLAKYFYNLFGTFQNFNSFVPFYLWRMAYNVLNAINNRTTLKQLDWHAKFRYILSLSQPVMR